MTKSLLDTTDYAAMMPEGWDLSGDVDWPLDYEGITFRLTAYCYRLDAYVRLSFRNGTKVPDAVAKLAAACRGAEEALVDGMEY